MEYYDFHNRHLNLFTRIIIIITIIIIIIIIVIIIIIIIISMYNYFPLLLLSLVN